MKERALAPSRAAESVSVAGANGVPAESSAFDARADFAEHGVEWGEDVHAMLEAAMKHPNADLMSLARSLNRERDGDSTRVNALVACVKAVAQSAIWKRTLASEHVLVEVPLIMQVAPDGAAEPPLNVSRGAIDLAFLEPEGWVIVDYKTDLVEPRSIGKLVEHYRPQVLSYADAWQTLLEKTAAKNKVHEVGLFFTRLSRYERVVGQALA